jgi:hypothetical protein
MKVAQYFSAGLRFFKSDTSRTERLMAACAREAIRGKESSVSILPHRTGASFLHQLPALNCWAHRFPPGRLFSGDPTELCDPHRDLLLFDAHPRPRDSGMFLAGIGSKAEPKQ